MDQYEVRGDPQERAPGHASDESGGTIVAWSEIEPGRFMPRRIRGSYRGGKLG